MTRGAQDVPSGDAGEVEIVQSLLWGMAQAISKNIPSGAAPASIWILRARAPTRARCRCFMRNSPGGSKEVAFRGENRLVRRIGIIPPKHQLEILRQFAIETRGVAR